MNASTGNILVVDDETNIRSGLRDTLVRDGHLVREASSAEAALQVLEAFDGEAAIVDIRMPGMSGIGLLEIVRARWPHIAVVLLTGQGTLASAMAAVKAGAHDYLLKPALPDAIRRTVTAALAVSRRRREQARLLASLRTSLQRLEDLPPPQPTPPRGATGTAPLEIGDLCIDLPAHQVCRGGEPLPLSPAEFKILGALASRAGQVVDYATLVRLGLGYEAESWEARELVKRHVFALRRKIETDPGSPRYVLNVRGVGYRLTPPQAFRA